MDPLRADDHMDLASSPVMPTDDIDFELDDVPQVLTEPNQDLMLQDEPEEPITGSDTMRSAINHNVDDDLMLDEETLIQEENQTEIADLIMDNQEDGHVQVDEEDDILYEDEEGFQEQEGLHKESLEEQPMEDGINAEDRQSILEVNISGYFDDDLQAEADIKSHANGKTQEDEDTNNTTEVSQHVSAAAAMDHNEEFGATAQKASNTFPERQQVSKSLKATPSNDAQKQEVNKGHYPADTDVKQADFLELEENATDVHEQEENGSKAVDNASPAPSSGPCSHSHVQVNRDLAHEENDDKPLTHTQLPNTVKVNYLETEMCLFPPIEDDDSEMFFLEDMSLAYDSLDKMLAACRDVLANTIGEDDELVLDVASLGLHIAEGSRYATQITLSQIVEVYVALAHNDNVANVEPLYCSLSSRVCLASQYAYLQSAANEGKTLIQISEEHVHVAGDDGENEIEYQQAQNPDQRVRAESKKPEEAASDDKEEATSINLRLEQASRLVDRASNNQSNENRSEADKEGVAENNGIHSKKTEPEEKERSQTPTVEGYSDAFEGDYDIFFNLCFKPGTCSCSSCANVHADTVVAASVEHDNEEPIEDIFGLAPQNLGSTGPADSDEARRSDEIGGAEPDIESNIQKSVSSRTVEAESNQLEEDLFSGDDGQTFHGDQDRHSDTQHYGDEFELEEQSNSGIVLELENGPNEEQQHEDNLENLVEQRPAPSSNLASSNGIGAYNQSYKRNESDVNAKADDELLNFDDTEEVGEKDQSHAAFISTHLPEADGNETTKSDSALKETITVHEATTTTQNDVSPSETDSKFTSVGLRRLQSPLGQSLDGNLTEPAENAPTTPSGGKNGSKRKAVEDEDDFDLFNTSTPDKKRRRPSP